MYRILIVEDDQLIASEIAQKLKQWKFECEVVKAFDEVLTLFNEFNPQLVIMDITLPYYDGFYWCQEIRKISKVPILFLSSKDSPMDVMMAVTLGADDYVMKPFSMTLLEAKIQAILRRTYDYHESKVYKINHAILDELGFIYYQNNKLELTKNEYRILLELIKQKGTIVSRDQLIESLWDDEAFVDDNTLTVNINRLRKKLDAFGLEDLIKTKKGIGYYVSEEIS